MLVEGNKPCKGQELQVNKLDDVVLDFKSKGANDGVDFETAVNATGYGKFHYLLLLTILPATWVTVIDTSVMSMILPSAECDLRLTLFDKGVLNAITYAGMIISAILWGFIADIQGRKKLLIYGYLADGVCNLLSSFSQSFWDLVFFKFVTGLIVNGPFAILMSYAAEFHAFNDRSRVLILIGLFSTLANISIPVLAWLIIPQVWSFEFFDGAFIFNSWRIFLAVWSAPGLIAVIGLCFFPESPKFLMSQGRNEEALQVFRKMFSMNTGKPPGEYPVKSLENELEKSCSMQNTVAVESIPEPCRKNLSKCFSDGCKQMKPLFFAPYLPNLLLCVTIQFCGLLVYNTFRLWLPQLFDTLFNFAGDSRGSPTFCEILDLSTYAAANETATSESSLLSHHCEKAIVDSFVYFCAIIVATATAVAFGFAGAGAKLLGNKMILRICYIGPLICVIAISWSTNNIMTLVLSCVFVSLASITVNAMIGVTVDLFPTSLRTMAVSLTMMSGRSGALLGNLLFPILLSFGCVVPFMTLAGFLILVVILTIFIPKPSGNLK